MERGGRLAAKAAVTDEILDKCKPIAGTPEDCIAAIEEYRDAGCTHVMLELWGEDRVGQLRLFAEKVLPHVRWPRPARPTVDGLRSFRSRDCPSDMAREAAGRVGYPAATALTERSSGIAGAERAAGSCEGGLRSP